MADYCCSCVCTQFISSDGTRPELKPVTEADIKENIRIIEIHRMFVYGFGKTVYPEYDFVSHDLSKFSSAELVPYTMKFIQKVDDSANPGWETALEHHYKNNPHHPQFWGDKSMPEELLKESIIDMLAARYQYRGDNETLPDRLTADMFDFLPMYLTRYTDSDRVKVNAELERLKKVDWSKIPIQGCNFLKVDAAKDSQ